MLIRQYRESDLGDVLASWESASRLAHPFLDEAFLAQEKKNIPEKYLPNADTWVIEIGDEVIGFIALMGDEVGAIFVKPEYHGRGAGKALMDKAREIQGDLEVEVFAENTIGRQFYAQYGFSLMAEKIHEETGRQLLRLKYTASERTQSGTAKKRR